MEDDMTTRDRFAAVALIGIIRSQCHEETQQVADGVRGGMREARAAYAYANAMMQAKQEYEAQNPTAGEEGSGDDAKNG